MFAFSALDHLGSLGRKRCPHSFTQGLKRPSFRRGKFSDMRKQKTFKKPKEFTAPSDLGETPQKAGVIHNTGYRLPVSNFSRIGVPVLGIRVV
jgi:hypothetical protein